MKILWYQRFKYHKNLFKRKKLLHRDIYRYRDIKCVISWYKILVISPRPNCLNTYLIMNVAYLKVLHFLLIILLHFFNSAPHCWCLFTSIVVHQLWSSAFSRGVNAGLLARAQERRVTFIYIFFSFWSNWDAAPIPSKPRKSLHKSFISHRQQGHFSVGPVHTTDYYYCWKMLKLIFFKK